VKKSRTDFKRPRRPETHRWRVGLIPGPGPVHSDDVEGPDWRSRPKIALRPNSGDTLVNHSDQRRPGYRGKPGVAVWVAVSSGNARNWPRQDVGADARNSLHGRQFVVFRRPPDATEVHGVAGSNPAVPILQDSEQECDKEEALTKVGASFAYREPLTACGALLTRSSPSKRTSREPLCPWASRSAANACPDCIAVEWFPASSETSR
jgi:hypothetical protein